MFHHIYIEERAFSFSRTEQILSHFPNTKQIKIDHYQSLFHRGHQNFIAQKQFPALFLACKEAPFLYCGAPVCQSFGNQHFYYTSCLMNCMFDCEYCYLQGMYPSANPVVFVNLEEIFEETKRLLTIHPVYLCISYDSDLLAMEKILSYCAHWLTFTAGQKDLCIELRTKCGYNPNFLSVLDVAKKLPENILLSLKQRFIFAFTLSLDLIQKTLEHNTGSLLARLKAAKTVSLAGFPVRICLDPLIYVPEYKTAYKALIDLIKQNLLPEQIKDISLGTFRVSKEYLKRMRKQRPYSFVLQFPYELNHGVFSYPKSIEQELIHTVLDAFDGYLPTSKFYLWENAY